MVPEDKVTEFVEKVRAAAGSNLESVVLYGSAASGDYHPQFSNVNLLCLLRDGSYPKLQSLVPVVKWWDKLKQPPPLVMTYDELERSTDVFTIELIDMVQHHRVLWGKDVIEKLQIPMQLHRMQVEYELREKLILLRQHLLLAGEDERKIRELLVRSVTSFATLFRHALISIGEKAPVKRRDAVMQLALKLGFDPSAVEKVLDVRERKAEIKNLHAFDIIGAYLATIEKVITAVDGIAGPEASGTS